MEPHKRMPDGFRCISRVNITKIRINKFKNNVKLKVPKIKFKEKNKF